MTFRRLTILYLFLIICFGTGISTADTIRLTNGDKISGRIIRLSEGKLTLETDYAGTISLVWDRVSGVVSDTPVQVVLNDKTSLYGNLKPAETEKVKLALGEIVETLSFDLAQVQAINPDTSTSKSIKVHGTINVGMSKTSGNTETEAHHIDARIVARTEKNRYTAGVEYNKAKDTGELIEEDYLGYAKYDHFLTKKWFVYANTLFEKNEFKDLSLRSTIGTGAGYQFYESELTNLFLEAGLGYVNNDYITAVDNDNIAGRWAVTFDRYLFDKAVQFFHFHEGYQGLDDTEDLFIRSETGFRFPLRNGFLATLQYNYDWDKTPSPGQEKYDAKYLFTLGYEFQ